MIEKVRKSERVAGIPVAPSTRPLHSWEKYTLFFLETQRSLLTDAPKPPIGLHSDFDPFLPT